MNKSERGRRQQVQDYLVARAGQWVDGPEIANEAVGGSDGHRRWRELRAAGLPVERRRHPDPKRDIWQYRWVIPDRVSPLRVREDECSCGRGPVGHTTLHSSTDKPGVVRVSRGGATDQYVDLRKAEAESEAARRVAAVKANRRESDDRPLIEHPAPVFGRLFCQNCAGHGGTVGNPCTRCQGSGFRS